ncbi:hypothetical protein BO83DRAFT_15815 [Aspergillus eucalypticola CBS 122712]|uniref:Uncharacterized protein n=1 Tax=Aspergillus eucalypticola (strain CBS 122712 / IBT 29274) TaxID=1448314 RepID=A0A317VNG5_ASPEC|nr:uncharacterized protein BO83DRAFT_15815 [Aspergillus eucalypticola CBS 122712]PWY74791.1 hypothetical protein BO83DRAFT_15815 [Aspergillus eucalypticola CBS 122712]
MEEESVRSCYEGWAKLGCVRLCRRSQISWFRFVFRPPHIVIRSQLVALFLPKGSCGAGAAVGGTALEVRCRRPSRAFVGYSLLQGVAGPHLVPLDTSTNRTFLCLCAGGKAAPLTELRILSFHSASIIALVIPPAEMSVCRNRAPVRPVGVITPWALSSLPGPGRAYEKVSQ